MRKRWLKSKSGVCAATGKVSHTENMTPMHERFNPLLDGILV